MRAMLAAVLLAAVVACGPRQVEVRSSPAPVQSEVSLYFTNNLSTPVDVFVDVAGTSTFLRRVGGNSTESIPVPGVPAGSTVTLRAAKTDNTFTYSKANVVLNGTYSWQVP